MRAIPKTTKITRATRAPCGRRRRRGRRDRNVDDDTGGATMSATTTTRAARASPPGKRLGSGRLRRFGGLGSRLGGGLRRGLHLRNGGGLAAQGKLASACAKAEIGPCLCLCPHCHTRACGHVCVHRGTDNRPALRAAAGGWARAARGAGRTRANADATPSAARHPVAASGPRISARAREHAVARKPGNGRGAPRGGLAGWGQGRTGAGDVRARARTRGRAHFFPLREQGASEYAPPGHARCGASDRDRKRAGARAHTRRRRPCAHATRARQWDYSAAANANYDKARAQSGMQTHSLAFRRRHRLARACTGVARYTAQAPLGFRSTPTRGGAGVGSMRHSRM